MKTSSLFHGLILFFTIHILSPPARAQVPSMINYQGRVTVSGTNFDGTGLFKFALVSGTTGATTYWSNDGSSTSGSEPTTAVSRTVTKGLYSVLLGDTTCTNMTVAIPASVFTNPDVRLRIWFSDGTHGSQLLTPDQRIAAVGYAMVASSVANGAITSAMIANGAVGANQLAPGAVTGTAIAVGAVGATQLAPGAVGAVQLANSNLTVTAGGGLTGGGSVSLGGSTSLSLDPSQVINWTAYQHFSGGLVIGFPSQSPSGNCFLQSTDNSWIRLNPSLAGAAWNGIVQAGDQGLIFEGTNGMATGGFVIAPHANATSGLRIDASGNVSIANGNLNVSSTVTATAFSGNGSGLSNIPATAVATSPPGMALIPAGSFTMGNVVGTGSDADITDAAPVTVNVSAFYMDVNLVSYAQWLSVYYWATNQGYDFRNLADGRAANNPVQSVNWYDCVKWCNARSQQAGLTPVYYTDSQLTQVYTTGQTDAVYVNWTAKGYRLPTEAEWEKAARGGLSGQRFPWGNTISENLANYYGKTASYSYDLGPDGYNAAFSAGATNYVYTSPVGYFAPNGYGLYDMVGNLYAWCWDWYGTAYAGGADPRGAASGTNRVLRGTSCITSAGYGRVAKRSNLLPPGIDQNVGFRTVLIP